MQTRIHVSYLRAHALLFTLLALSACGAAPASSPAPATPAAARVPARDDWESMTWEERHDTMTFLVLPNMARLFQRMQGTAYPALTCRSCHGADAEAASYRMPHGLTPLDPQRMPDPSADTPRGRTAKWMAEEVTPLMARLLGKPEYDSATNTGFGCFQCHPTAH